SGYYLPFEYIELNSMVRSYVSVNYKEEVKVGDVVFKLLNSGHLPGGASVLIEAEGKRLLYTSDFNTIETRLLPGAELEYENLDAVIIESTYADEDHTERKLLEEKFIGELNEVVEAGGTVLVPAFSVGRAQEIACILAAYHFEHPVVIDGMVKEASRIIMNYLEFLRDPKLFMDAIHMVGWVNDWRERKRVAKKPGVIIAPAGMLKGGPATYYIQIVGKKSRNAIFLVGYQIPGTPGRELLDSGRCVIDGKVRKIKAKVGFFDFSSHAGAKELKNVIKTFDGEPTVFTIHGANGNCQKFARWIKEEAGLEAKAPNPGEKFVI
ncbi:MAG: MBL fold metallo-hydrolase, partial [Candidatus Bathyarchaeota archaeon]|nr:MBL fold metallo-hydrolase [Candidatus Bathyarchaeota archaeon]